MAIQNSQNGDAIREGGGIPALIKVLREGDQEAQAYAVSAFLNLAILDTQNGDAIREERGSSLRF